MGSLKQEWNWRKNHRAPERAKRKVNEMKCLNGIKRFGPQIVPLILLCFLPGILHGVDPPFGEMGLQFPTNLNSWTFSDTNTWTSDNGYAPVSFTNLAGSKMGNIGSFSMVLDNTNTAWLRYNLMETNGATNLMVDVGTLTLWFAPNWASATTNQNGSGPNAWGRLIEVGAYTTNANYGWWSLFVDGGGTNIYFCAQTNSGDGALVTYLSAPIDWATNDWHMIALTYSATNSALYLDGQLADTGAGVSVFPGPEVRTNGFWIGSDGSGVVQAHGLFDDLYTFDSALDGESVTNLYHIFRTGYAINPYNFRAYLRSATSTPTIAFRSTKQLDRPTNKFRGRARQIRNSITCFEPLWLRYLSYLRSCSWS
jgi:hypothetical protein